MNAQLRAMQAELGKLDGSQIRDLRSAFNTRVKGSDGFVQEAVKAKSATQMFTEALVKQDVTVGNAIKNRRLFNQVLKEQYQLQRMTAVQWGKTASGSITADVILPKGLPDEVDKLANSWRYNTKSLLDNRLAMGSHIKGTDAHTEALKRFTAAQQVMHMRLGMTMDMFSSFSSNMVKWGKNTQWAGRQLMVGFTVPFLALAGVAGVAANTVDKEMTRVLKVYDYSAAAAKDSAVREAEANQLRAQSLENAKAAAINYGVSMEDTLNMEAELAATGLAGNELLERTNLLTKAMILGELDKQEAIKASTALQTAYGHSTKDMGDDFNYMTAMANATSLGMDDFVAGLPRAAKVLNNVGVDFKQFGILMVALKQAGIEAGEGANGLRSMGQRLLQVTPAAEKAWAAVLPKQESITAIVKANSGQLIPSLTQLGEAMKELEPFERQQIITRIFGIQRANIAMNVMDGLVNKTNQMTKAFQVADMSAEQLADQSAASLATVTNSASNKIARAIQGIKAQLVELGGVFLPVAASIINLFGGIVKAVNGLSEGRKKFLAFGLAAVAGISVLVMFVGLLSNLIGTLAGAATGMAKLGLKYRTMTVEQRAQAMLAEKSAAVWRDQGLAAQTLSSQLQKLVGTLDAVAVAQHNARIAAGAAPIPANVTQYRGTQPGMPGPNIPAGTPVVINNGTARRASAGEVAMARNAAHLEAIAEDSQRAAAASTVANRNWGGIAAKATAIGVAGGIAVTTMQQATGSSHSFMSNLMNSLLIAGMIGPAVAKGLTATKVTGALNGLKTSFAGVGSAFTAGRGAGGVRGLVAGLRAALPVAGTLAGTILRFAGPVGALAGVALTWKQIHDGMEDARKKQEQINNSAKEWGKILGFNYQTAASWEKVNEKDSAGNNAVKLAAKFREANKAAAENLDTIAKTGDEQKLLNAAIEEGVKVRMHGGNEAQARLATATALAVAGKAQKEIDNLMLKVDATVDFGDLQAVAKRQGEQFGQQFQKAMEGQFVKADNWMTRLWESMRGGMTAASAQAARDAGAEFWNGLNAQETQGAKTEYFKSIENDFLSRTKGIVDKVNEQMKAVPGQVQFNPNPGINWQTGQQNSAISPRVSKTYSWDNLADASAQGKNLAEMGIPKEYIKQIQDAAKYEREFVQEMARRRGLSVDMIAKINTMADAQKYLNLAEMGTSQAMKGWEEEMRLATQSGEQMTEGQKLYILNQWRAKAGMDAATSSAQGFGAALVGASGAVDELNNSIDAGVWSVEEWGDAWAKATKETMGNARDMAMNQADALMEEYNQAQLDAIDKKYDGLADKADNKAEKRTKKFEDRADAIAKKYDRQGDALDKRQKARAKAVAAGYDARIKKIDDTIAAEEKAEATRQRIFEAEQTRMQRLAELANKNIDFNVAVNTGNLDEAAKQFNDIQATTTGWAIQDATAGSQDASKARIDGLNNQKDTIGKQKDAALEALKEKDDAEKQALKDKEDREKKALEAAKERYAKEVEANKKALAQQREDAKKAEQARLDNKKHTLEMELLEIRASTPRNKAEYDKQIKAIEGAYQSYGVRLQDYGNRWTGYIGDYLTSNVAAAAASLKDDINWKAYAAKISDDFVKGAFNMNVNEFGKWITTGKAPNDAFTRPAKKNVNSHQGSAHNDPGGSHAVLHSGGPVGGGSKFDSRRGYAASNSRMHSEVNVLAKKGEYMINDKAVSKYGTGVMDAINSGKYDPTAMGGGELGLAGILGGGLFAQMKNAMQMGVAMAAMRKMEMTGNVNATTGKQQAFGSIKLDAVQLKNAQTIMATGKSLGASKRDLTIALMTAMQESNLRNINYGDRDSMGLFQQRPSQGWGSVEQIMDPKYSSTKFFKALFGVKNRDSMPLTMAAQAVQRSAFPNAYAKWQGMASALVNGTKFNGGGMGLQDMLGILAANGPAGMGGDGRHPLKAGTYSVSSEYGMRVNPVTGIYKLHDGIDLAAPGGTPIYAVKAGKVISAGPAGGYGNYTVIQHADGTKSGYAHQSAINVGVGQTVKAGQKIGAVGTTGNSTGNHLHFQMGGGAGWDDPRKFIPGLRKGGFTLNDGYAMLHKNETVLTADLSDKLKTGINQISTGNTGGNKYDITIDMRGTIVHKDMDFAAEIEKGVTKALQKRESKLGRSRKVSA